MLSKWSLILSMTGRQEQEDDGGHLIFLFSRLVSGEMQKHAVHRQKLHIDVLHCLF